MYKKSEASFSHTSDLESIRKRMNEINYLISRLQRETSEKLKELSDEASKTVFVDEEHEQYTKYVDEWHNLAKIYDSLRLSS